MGIQERRIQPVHTESTRIENTLAGRLAGVGLQSELSGAVQLGAWTDDEDVGSGTECWEDSIAIPYYGAVLTILTL